MSLSLALSLALSLSLSLALSLAFVRVPPAGEKTRRTNRHFPNESKVGKNGNHRGLQEWIIIDDDSSRISNRMLPQRASY